MTYGSGGVEHQHGGNESDQWGKCVDDECNNREDPASGDLTQVVDVWPDTMYKSSEIAMDGTYTQNGRRKEAEADG